MIFENPFFTEMLLPFLLVFVVVFAILQKSKVLGEGKAQVDAIVGLVIGLLLIGVPGPRDILVGIMPWMAVGVAVILVFLILYGFVAGDLNDEKNMPKGLKYTFMGLAAVFTVGVVLFVTGLGSKIWDSFGGSGDIWMNIVMIVLVLGAMSVAVFGTKNKV
jgi:predicted Abi (CAAX) family protease